MLPGVGSERQTSVNDDGVWRILSNIMVLEGTNSRSQVAEKIVAAGQALDLPESVLKQLSMAISEAIQAIPNREASPGLLIVRFFVRENTKPDIARPPTMSEMQEKAGQGWSFFLVQQCTDAHVPADRARVDVIELFFYQE